MGVRVTSLDNGLTVATETMAHLQSAALGVWVGAGSRAEETSQHGISHLLEHMAFKGTSTRTAVQIAESIEAVGGELNAATSTESTSYYARVLPGDVPLALDILADILQDSAFDPEEMAREQHVIAQEIGAAHDMPEDWVFDIFQEAAFPGQAVGRPIMGTKASLAAMEPDDLRGFLASHYRAPGMVLAAAGNVDHEAVVALAKETFGGLRSDAPAEQAPARYIGGESIESRDLEETQVLIGFEGRAYDDPSYYAAQILSSILGGGMASRLFQEVRERRGLCYSIYSFHWPFLDTGLFGVHAATAEEDLEALMPVIVDEISRMADGPADAELARAKAQLKAGLLMALESPMMRAGQAARQILIHGKPITPEELVERVEAVTIRQVRTLAEQIFHMSPPTLAAVGPSERLMRREEIASRLGSALADAAE